MRARLAIGLLLLVVPAFGQWAVFDVAGLQQSVANYGAMVEQIARQGEQIANQVRQIQQMEDNLKRIGNMADIKNVVGFPNLRIDLGLPTRIRVWAAQAANGRSIFGDTRDGVFVPVEQTFPDFDGGSINRDTQPYAAAQQIVAKVDEFKEVQADVYARREQLKRAIAQTSEALQGAETEAEEKKLEAILNAQYSQLSALDSEVALSAAEIQVRVAESTVMHQATVEADAEARRKLAQEEARKIGRTFKPMYDSVLRHVTEERFSR
jgi:septal ring factor EnvC (AmiA/AmiB activator)